MRNAQTLRSLRTASMILEDVRESLDGHAIAARIGAIIDQLDGLDDELTTASA